MKGLGGPSHPSCQLVLAHDSEEPNLIRLRKQPQLMVASEVAIVAGAVAVLGAYFGVIKAKQRKLIQAALGFGVAVAGAVYFFLSLAGIS